ncbi:murein hydrolase activator EnvC family protein [Virgibacillus byunsanensis]|uniref:Murein hydrolase activator EnvC family protein n=1 Tax=Virgibacillus byunsanensis TaxID=570945 RepID=A0ABW3LLB9_9BACI
MKRTVLYILVITLIMGTSLVDWKQVSAQSRDSIQKEIKEFENKQDELKEKQGNVNSKKKNTENKIDENLNKQDTVKNEIASIDQKLSKTQSAITTKENEITQTNNEIEELKSQIDELKNQLEELKAEIEALIERIERREALLKDRLRAIQKNGGDMKYMEVILGSQSFGDFISRSSAVNTIMDQDKNIMETHLAEKKQVETKKAELEKKKTDMEAKKVEVEDKKTALEGQKNELVSLKGQLDSQMAEKEKLQAKLEEEHQHLEELNMSLEEQQRVLKNQEAAVREAKKSAKGKLQQFAAKDKSSGLSAGGNGIFKWPAQGRFSSGYGPRRQPYGDHYGIDIAASKGTTISAAASGIVTRSEYSGSYGHVVYIYHPQHDMTTVYAHLSTRSVSNRQEVNVGQKLGGMGNTGQSFGDHLHFEVHHGIWSYRGGVNPMQYLN